MHLKSRFLIPTLMLLVILPMIATDIYLPAFSFVREELGASDLNILDTLTSYMFGYSCSLLFAGALSDVYGRRPVLIVGIAIFFIASIGCSIADSVEQLMVWRFFQALGGGCGTLVARVVVRDVYDSKSQVKVLSYLASGLVLSPILGPIIGAYISSYFGWRPIFFALAFFSLAAWLLIWRYVDESLSQDRCRMTFQFSEILFRSLSLWRHREFVFNTLIISFAWVVYFTFLSTSPALIQGTHNISAIEYGYIFSATISGFVFGAMFIRWKISTLNLKQLVNYAGALILISTLVLSILMTIGVEVLVLKLFFVFLSLFGVGIIFPATQAGVTGSFKESIGLVSGMFYSTEMLFGAIFGYVLSRIGDPSWAATSLMMLIAAFCIVATSFFDGQRSLSNSKTSSKALLK